MAIYQMRLTISLVVLATLGCSTIPPLAAGKQTEIEKVLSEKRPAFEECYNSRQDPDIPLLAGEVTVLFNVVYNGSVSDAQVMKTTLKNSPIEKCILSAIENTKFPASEGLANTEVKHVIHFGVPSGTSKKSE